MADDDHQLAMGAGAAAAAAAAAAGDGLPEPEIRTEPESRWVRQAREAIQSSHTLTTPLAEWAPEPVEPHFRPLDAPPAENEPPIVIPESVLHARPPLRLPEDAVCRSPIAGLVIAVFAAAGEPVARRRPVMVIEAMKMQNNVCPEIDGVLKAVHVAPGDVVKPGQVLFELV